MYIFYHFSNNLLFHIAKTIATILNLIINFVTKDIIYILQKKKKELFHSFDARV